MGEGDEEVDHKDGGGEEGTGIEGDVCAEEHGDGIQPRDGGRSVPMSPDHDGGVTGRVGHEEDQGELHVWAQLADPRQDHRGQQHPAIDVHPDHGGGGFEVPS